MTQLDWVVLGLISSILLMTLLGMLARWIS